MKIIVLNYYQTLIKSAIDGRNVLELFGTIPFDVNNEVVIASCFDQIFDVILFSRKDFKLKCIFPFQMP